MLIRTRVIVQDDIYVCMCVLDRDGSRKGD